PRRAPALRCRRSTSGLARGAPPPCPIRAGRDSLPQGRRNGNCCHHHAGGWILPVPPVERRGRPWRRQRSPAAPGADVAERTAAAPEPAPSGWRNPRVRRPLQLAVSILLVGGIIWFVFKQFADLSSVWAAMRWLTAGGLLVL